MQPCIIGICGGKGHGKDTCAQALKRAYPELQIKYFAGPLKDICAEVFDLSREAMDDPLLKEAPMPEIIIDDYLDALKDATGLPLLPRNKKSYSIRQLLQYVGTDYVRSVAPDYWIDRARESFAGNPVICPDLRFPNEMQVVKESPRNLILQMVKLDAPPSNDGHASENSIDPSMVDCMIGVKTGDFETLERLAPVMCWSVLH